MAAVAQMIIDDGVASRAAARASRIGKSGGLCDRVPAARAVRRTPRRLRPAPLNEAEGRRRRGDLYHDFEEALLSVCCGHPRP